jgi:hypothetical protein
MPIVGLLPGCSSQTTHSPVRRPRYLQTTRFLVSCPPTHLISAPPRMPRWPSSCSPFVPSLTGHKAFFATHLRSSCHAARVNKCRLWLARFSTKVSSFYVDDHIANNITATSFIPQDFQVQDIATWLNANYTPSPSGPDALRAGLDKLISLYPTGPSAGSPFGTGNETFGTGPGYKRAAAIRMVFHSY